MVDKNTNLIYAFGGETYKPKYMYHNSILCVELDGISFAQCDTKFASFWKFLGAHSVFVIGTVLGFVGVLGVYVVYKQVIRRSAETDILFKTE